MSKVYPHIVPDIEQWPINKLSINRSFFVNELREYTLTKFSKKSSAEKENIIATTLYHEKIRIKTNPWKVDPPNEGLYFKKLEQELKNNQQLQYPQEKNDDILRRLTNRYAEEIVSSFDPKTFKRARKILTFLFKRLFNSASESGFRRLWGSKSDLYNRFHTVGDIEQIRNLMQKGTVIVVPTHFSNLDSILIGYAMDAVVGVPAFSYGAGLNLYDYELFAYFMNRLGAYKLDRRKKNPIYMEVLKSFSALSAKKGVNTIFFPGGTRSRNGKIEDKVKLGLFGTMIEAQRNLCLEKSDKKVYIVPLVIGYHFVLEAESLIDQYLKITGKERYLKSSVKPTNLRKILGFIMDLFYADSEITLSFGNAMDVFGNSLDEDGRSFDAKHREIMIADYFKSNGEITEDLQRERIYTSNLGKKIIESYFKNNVVLSSHLMAHIAFAVHQLNNPKSDIYSLLSLPLDSFEITQDQMVYLIQMVQSYLIVKDEKEEVRISPIIKESAVAIIENGMKHLGAYHDQQPLTFDKKSNSFKSQDFKTLYYYHNRLEGYNLISVISNALKSQVA